MMETEALISLHVAYETPALLIASLKYESVVLSMTGSLSPEEKNRNIATMIPIDDFSILSFFVIFIFVMCNVEVSSRKQAV